DRANTLRKVNYKMVGAAGTSFLMAQIAENMCRKLKLNCISTLVTEGFTGSDCIPLNVSRDTLFVANSNSGGTSDTIKLTRELNSLPRIAQQLIDQFERGEKHEDWGFSADELRHAASALRAGTRDAEVNAELLAHIRY